MKIIIGNQKGGVGKTTLCILYANYLAMVKKKDVIILDMDFQESIKNRREEDKGNKEMDLPYEVIALEAEQYVRVAPQLDQTEGVILIDLAGKIDDNSLVPIYMNAEAVICPFLYEKITFESTLIFAQVIKHLKPDMPIYFVPNRTKAGVKYETKEHVNAVLRQFGEIAPEIPDRVMVQRIDTISLSEDLKTVLEPSFSFLDRKLSKI
jgi:chromosome partitioning protein